ncbi:hypothetical protein C8Q79DRAFT_974698 [Trametes meyenii]|nr:hypothetical protein C8Q79DRAFT_974698 [Trametes meyenii]
MSRIPPALLYLTIYNPTLKPATLDPDDEDAEELAHILLHTAREHAVSRDRILRQVGLAKALVNFSEMFNAGVPCENVHSQARRMIMFSPEPNFWIHACYEVAKTPRSPPSANKSKDSSKGRPKGKDKGPSPRSDALYDYHDGTVHDEALKSHFKCGYENFKLLHGSFTSVLSTWGQEALELQLERFFTIWAWKWDIDDEDFGVHLGIPLHPLCDQLTPILEAFQSRLPQELMSFALIPPYVILPRNHRYPTALVRYVLSRIPPPPTPVARNGTSSSTTIPTTAVLPSKVSSPIPPTTITPAESVPNGASTLATNLLAMPTIPSMNLGLDVKSLKWGWPGYLTFGKSGAGSKPSTSPSTLATTLASVDPPGPPKVIANGGNDEGPKPDSGLSGKRRETLDVDTVSLLEAISTESIGSYTRAASPAPSGLSRSSQLGESTTQDISATISAANSGTSVVQGSGDTPQTNEALSASSVEAAVPEAVPRVLRSFLRSTVHLSRPDDPLATEKKRLLHLTQDECTIALVVDIEHSLDLAQLADDSVGLIEAILKVIEERKAKSRGQPIPSATKILQPKDKYIIAMDDYTTASSAGFPSRSEHLYGGQRLLRSDHDVLEVFSRGQNPQHWYIGKRGLGTSQDGHAIDGEAYMEVSRKETTLTDVDNELASVVKRFTEHLRRTV